MRRPVRPRPKPPLSIALYNSAWQRHGDRRVARYVAARGRRGVHKPLAVAAVEMHDRVGTKPMNLREFLGDGWDVAQDLSGGQRAGQAFALREGDGWEIVRTGLDDLSPPKKGVVGPRFIRWAELEHDDGDRRMVGVPHFPLRFTGLQDEAREALKRWVNRQRRSGIPFVILGDINGDHRTLRRYLKLPHSAAIPGDVMACLWSKGWGPVGFTLDRDAPHGTDHGVLVMHSGPGARRILARTHGRRVTQRMVRTRHRRGGHKKKGKR